MNELSFFSQIFHLGKGLNASSQRDLHTMSENMLIFLKINPRSQYELKHFSQNNFSQDHIFWHMLSRFI